MTTDIAKRMTEAELAANILDAAAKLGWRVKRDPTWRATCACPGFPDLTMARETANGQARLIFAELKTERGKLTDPQVEWLALLSMAGHRAYVWRPRDWLSGGILEVLS
jgi:hypothetical protein